MTKVKCPNCGRETPYSTDNPYRPFCSKRCKDSDLYGWLEDDPDEEDGDNVSENDRFPGGGSIH